MSIKGKRIFLTGGAGFIGSSFIERIIDSNEIIVYDSLQRNALESKPYIKNHKNLTIIQSDILNLDHLIKSIKGANIVLHLAAIAGINTVIKSPVSTMEVNVLGTSNVLKAVMTLEKCERFIYFSTSEVFGPRAFKSEETDFATMGFVGEARWTYGVSKLASEHLVHAYFKEFKIPAIILRPFNVYGPGQIGEGAIHVFVKKAIANEDIEIHGDGNQIRAWCYIDDMVDAILLSLEKDNIIGESFNIGNSKAVITIYGLANTVIRVCNSKSKIKFTRKDYTDIELRIPSVKKAKKLLNFEAKVDLEEGILKTAEWYRNHL